MSEVETIVVAGIRVNKADYLDGFPLNPDMKKAAEKHEESKLKAEQKKADKLQAAADKAAADKAAADLKQKNDKASKIKTETAK